MKLIFKSNIVKRVLTATLAVAMVFGMTVANPMIAEAKVKPANGLTTIGSGTDQFNAPEAKEYTEPLQVSFTASTGDKFVIDYSLRCTTTTTSGKVKFSKTESSWINIINITLNGKAMKMYNTRIGLAYISSSCLNGDVPSLVTFSDNGVMYHVYAYVDGVKKGVKSTIIIAKK